ncbi:MFS transporter [Microbacterium aurum]
MSNVSTTEPEPTAVSVRYQPKTKAFRRYLLSFTVALLGIGMIWGVSSILLSLQVQQLEFAQYFTGADAHVNLQQLSALQAEVAAHTVTPTAEQQRLLGILAEYNAAKASGLSLVTSVGVFVTMLIQPIIGTLSDRTRSKRGRRAPWIAGGAIAGGALVCIMPLAPTVAVLVVLWTLAQLVLNIAQGPIATTMADRVPKEKIGLTSMISGILGYGGAIAGMILAGVLFNIIGLGAYVPFGVLLVLTVLMFVVLAPDKSSTDLVKPRLKISTLLFSFVAALRDRDYRWAWIAKVILYTGYALSTVYSVYMLQSYIHPALNAAEAATMAPLLSFAGIPAAIIGMAVSGRWSDKIGRRKPFVIAASIIMAVSYLVPFFWASLPALFIQAAVMGLGFGMFIVIDGALFVEVLPDKAAAGRDLGLSQLGTNLGQALGPMIAGIVVTIFGGAYGPVWPVAFVLVLISAFLVIPIRRVR